MQPSRNVVTIDDVDAVAAGQFVALYVVNCNLRPVLKVDGDNIEIMWLEGSYSRPWKAAKTKQGRSMVEWKDTVPKASIIRFDFELTPSNKLRKATVQHLKNAYSKIDRQ